MVVAAAVLDDLAGDSFVGELAIQLEADRHPFGHRPQRQKPGPAFKEDAYLNWLKIDVGVKSLEVSEHSLEDWPFELWAALKVFLNGQPRRTLVTLVLSAETPPALAANPHDDSVAQSDTR